MLLMILSNLNCVVCDNVMCYVAPLDVLIFEGWMLGFAPFDNLNTIPKSALSHPNVTKPDLEVSLV